MNASPSITSYNYKEEIKFRFNTWIYIHAKINGEENSRELLVDTGSPCFISFDTKDELKIKSKRFINSKKLKAEYCAIPTSIGNINYGNVGYMVIDFLGVKGLIGVNLMQNSIWCFNFRDSVIIITDRLDTLRREIGGYKIPFKILDSQKTPFVNLVVNETDTLSAMIDMGAVGSILTNSEFKFDKIKSDDSANVVTSIFNKNKYYKKQYKDSIIEGYDIKIKSVKIGELEIKNAIVHSSSDNDGLNLVGVDFLKNFIVTIDWINYNIYLNPIQGRMVSSNKSSFGFYCSKNDSIISVEEVYKNSSAEMQGMQSGDEIEIINNIPAKEISEKIIGLINNGKFDDEIELKIKDNKNILYLKKYDLFSSELTKP